MMGDNQFAIMDNKSILVYSRRDIYFVEALDVPPPPKKSRRAARKNSMLASATAVEVTEEASKESDGSSLQEVKVDNDSISTKNLVYNLFKKTKNISLNETALRCPVVLKVLKDDCFLLGYDDGFIQYFRYPGMTDRTLWAKPDTKESSRAVTPAQPHVPSPHAVLLCEFQAHNVSARQQIHDSRTRGVLSIQQCDWMPLCGGRGYVLEIVSTGSDGRIGHWGLRRIAAHQRVTNSSAVLSFDRTHSVISDEGEAADMIGVGGLSASSLLSGSHMEEGSFGDVSQSVIDRGEDTKIKPTEIIFEADMLGVCNTHR
jgi:hypothetical protein